MAKQEHLPTTSTTAGAAMVAVAAVGDPDGTRAVTAIVALLAVIGVVLVMTAVWLYRSTRPDPEVLAPLEIMGDRGWRRADPVWQRRRLDEVRPEGAEPLLPSVAPPDVDEAFDLGPAGSGFDDLHDHAPDAAHADESDVESDEDADDDADDGSDDGDGADGDVDDAPGGPVAPADPTLPLVRDAARQESRPVVIDTSPQPAPEARPAAYAPPPAPMDPLIARSRAGLDGASTPTGIARPTPDDLPDHDVDPALLAAAMAELDAELGRLRRSTADPSHDDV